MTSLFALIWNLVNLQSVLFGLVIGGIVYYWFTNRKYKLPPGPIALPLLGNISLYLSNRFFEDVFKKTEKYGPIISVNIVTSTVVILNDIESVLEALVKKRADFASRATFHSTEIWTDGGKDIVLARYTPAWKYHRRVAGKALRYLMRGSNLEIMVNETTTLFLDKMAKEKGPFEPKNYLSPIIGNMLYRVCFGRSCGEDDPDVKRFLELDEQLVEGFKNGLLEDVVPFLKDIYPSKRYKMFLETIGEVKEMVWDRVNKHKETFDENDIRDFTDSMLLARAEEEREENEENISKMTDTHIVQIVIDIFVAGIDTSRSTLNWFVLFMAAHPDIQSKCHAIIDKVVGRDRLPSLSDKGNLDYIEACLHETMRMGTVAPFGVPHETVCDTDVGGYDVPKGTTVLINHWALHHDPKAWENVDKFDPQRYLDTEGKLGPKPESWLPFSAGSRTCLGEPVAKVELVLICIRLLHRFVFKLPPGVTTKFEDNCNASALEPLKYEVVAEDRMKK